MYEGAGLGPEDVDLSNPYDGYAPMTQFFLGGLPVVRRKTRRRVLRRRHQGRGTAPVLLERRQFGERAHPYGHVHRQHRTAPRHGWRTAGRRLGGDGAGGLHHAKQRRLDHVRQTPELTACDTGDHRVDPGLAAVTPRASSSDADVPIPAIRRQPPKLAIATDDRYQVIPPGSFLDEMGPLCECLRRFTIPAITAKVGGPSPRSPRETGR
jgi:hypothetical protein